MFFRIFKKFADIVASDDASLKIDRMSGNSTKSGQMPSYGDDIKNAHVSKIGRYGEWSGQREMMWEIRAPRIFIFLSHAQAPPRGPESVDRTADRAIIVPASMHAALIHVSNCSQPKPTLA
jgi:hypothetical protein